MYDLDFVNEVLDRVKNGEKKLDVVKDVGIGYRTLYLWLSGKTPHKRLFNSEKEWQLEYYKTHKQQFKRNSYLSRLGIDGIKILDRDNHKCCSCGKEKTLQLHHIDGNPKNNNEKNLITLCKLCHSALNWVLTHPTLTHLFIKYEEGTAINNFPPTPCPLCNKEYRYFLAFAKHMLRKHKWPVEKSLSFFSSK